MQVVVNPCTTKPGYLQKFGHLRGAIIDKKIIWAKICYISLILATFFQQVYVDWNLYYLLSKHQLK